ncbi:hypothetical protein [Dictyobacter aurantiacus]|uniref:Uncharacterized protein n=1 Tax=Dictyobacter aurantiacus TaxID=1936993 RepID=A0A401ZMT5_9CHLR|nr:hypothetical protein [Dictyobacter aurantiacus]GCE08191.1 hypothetical protein KDAU_55200 [Dictyobacter aurantiacus]
MQTSMKTSEIAPQSALRHRRIAPMTEEVRFVQPRASLTRAGQEPHTTGGLPAGTVNKLTKTRQLPQPQPRGLMSDMHWSLPAGLAMLVMVLVFWLGQMAINWGMTTYDDIRYGRPRTVQADAFVGHESGQAPSHFIALNDHGRIEIIEFPGGDPAHSRIFMGPQIWGNNADLVPINISFVPSTTDPKLKDMQISFQNTHILFRNEKGTFVMQNN